MKKQDTENDKSSDQQIESNHPELKQRPNSSARSNSEIAPADSFTLRMDQVSRMLKMDLRLESEDDLLVCPNDHGGWMRAYRREDGTSVILDLPHFTSKSSSVLFMQSMVELLLEEARDGLHTQESLDTAMDICEKLLPSRQGWVDANALHSFLEEERPFSWWCQHVAYYVEDRGFHYYRHTSVTAAWEAEGCMGAQQAKRPFRVNTSLAFRVALSAPTHRGGQLREMVMNLTNSNRYQIFVSEGDLIAA